MPKPSTTLESNEETCNPRELCAIIENIETKPAWKQPRSKQKYRREASVEATTYPTPPGNTFMASRLFVIQKVE
jgi:hypothetical protein